MILGLYTHILKKISKRYALILHTFKYRTSRAKIIHEKLRKDIQNGENYTHLFRYLEKIGFQHQSLPESIWKLIGESLEKQERNPALTEELKKVSALQLTPGEWLELSMYLLSFGLFEASVICRRKSYTSLNTVKCKLYYNLFFSLFKLSLLFDQGKWEEGSEILKKKIFFDKDNPYYHKFFLGKKSVGQAIHKDYYDLVNGKSVAVIGPLAFDQDYSAEIAEADLVIELNAVASKRELVKAKYHGNPDIVYYNNSRNAGNAENNFNDVVKGTKYFVIKNDKYIAPLSKVTNCRVTPQSTTLTWNGTFSMMEITLSDLLLFDPAEVKVYGVDLYLSFDYSSSYGNAPPQFLKSITMNFTAHDIFTQFLFMKKLFDEEYIKADQRLSNVLSLDLDGYAAELKKLYPVYLDTGN